MERADARVLLPHSATDICNQDARQRKLRCGQGQWNLVELHSGGYPRREKRFLWREETLTSAGSRSRSKCLTHLKQLQNSKTSSYVGCSAARYRTCLGRSGSDSKTPTDSDDF